VGLRPEARHPRSSEAARTPVTQPKKVFQSAPRIVAFEIEQMFEGRNVDINAVKVKLNIPASIKVQSDGDPIQVRSFEPEIDSTRRQARRSREKVSKASPTPKLTLKQVYERYIDDPACERSGKTLSAYKSAYGRLVELVGENTLIESVTREVCRDVLDTLRFLPPNATKRFGKISAKAAAQLAKAEGHDPMSPTTVNAYLNKLSALFNWAENEGYIDKNPARGLRVIDPVRKKDKRQPFSTEQLTKIFNAPLYRGCVDDEAGYAHAGANHPRRGRFWVPVIGLYSGMRLNEICQLDVNDVRAIDGIECFVVTIETAGSATEKKLKTENAERIIPIHPKLKDFGFVQYVAERRENGRGKLFPELSLASTGYYSDNFSKWFANFLEKVEAKAAKTSFHSFRHNFRDALREARIPRDITYALGGWANENGDGDATAENYGRGYQAATLWDAIKQVKYRTICLDHLSR
jgi:integrase